LPGFSVLVNIDGNNLDTPRVPSQSTKPQVDDYEMAPKENWTESFRKIEVFDGESRERPWKEVSKQDLDEQEPRRKSGILNGISLKFGNWSGTGTRRSSMSVRVPLCHSSRRFQHPRGVGSQISTASQLHVISGKPGDS